MPKGKKRDYDVSVLNLALKEINEGGKIREIARKYGIPKSTLHFKLKNPTHKTTFGPAPILTVEEEQLLVFWIKEMMRKGFPLNIEDLKQSVYKFLTENPRPNKFKNNYPADGWVRGFLKRHPAIVQRTSEGVTQSSACVSEPNIRKWFAEIHSYLSDNNLLNILNDPRRVFNGDESGFQLCPKTGKVLAAKGTKNVYHVETSNAKESITVMFTFSAAGYACPPMVVYNYQRIPQKIVDGVPKEWGIGRSDNGWMTSELFFEYIANVYHPYLIQKGINLPVIYFLDGHKSHLTYNVSKLCKELGIEVIALYPNATRILQPADVAVFRPVKAAWKDATRLWYLENQGEPITKVNFAKVLEIALEKSLKPETLINGFKTCGLVPFDPDAIDYTKCLGGTTNNQDENVPPNLSRPIETNSQNVITLSKFSEIVGPSKMSELKSMNEPRLDTDQNSQILYQLYSVFNVNNSPDLDSYLINTSDNNIQNIVSLEPHSNTTEQMDHEPPSYDPRLDDLQFLNEDIGFGTTQHVTPAKQVFKTALNASQGNEPHSNTFEHIDHELTSYEPRTDELQFTSLNASQANANTENVEKSPAFKVISNSLFGRFLTLPKTPERKGKKNTVKMPFAITSAKYRAMFQEQKQKKEIEIKTKEERKKTREENKIKKAKAKKEKKCVNKETPQTTNACKVCTMSTKTTNRVVCDMCSSIFHIRCVPAKHQKHVPEDIAIDMFVCHHCYKEDDNDTIEDISSEKDSEDDLTNLMQNTNDTEDSEVGILYDMVMQQKKDNKL